MIELRGISKKFDDVIALTDVSGTIREGSVFGLVGTNGAGKSTCLRMISGVLKPDAGEVLVDEKNVYEDAEIRGNLFFISDDPYYFPNATPREMMRYYAAYYNGYDRERFSELMGKFGLQETRKIRTFSKGMKKQLSVILGICANTKYLICDETFDGLDPVMRQAVKSIFAVEMMNRDFTPVIASHNLRELEDLCDHVGLLHRGGMLLSKDVEELKSGLSCFCGRRLSTDFDCCGSGSLACGVVGTVVSAFLQKSGSDAQPSGEEREDFHGADRRVAAFIRSSVCGQSAAGKHPGCAPWNL